MTHFFDDVCPECGSFDTVASHNNLFHECLECGEIFEGADYDGRPQQIRVKKPYKPPTDDRTRS